MRRRSRPAPGNETLAQALFSQGFGTRRDCDAMVRAGRVAHQGRVLDDPALELPADGLVLVVDGQSWPFHAQATVLLHKPAGHECSRQPVHHPSVLSLLPAPLRQRGVQTIGRLDADTTGVLLLTDDGALLHRLTSPRHHVPKVYEVRTRHPVDATQVERLLEGVLLHDDPQPARAMACSLTGPQALRLTLTEGRYHQVKRMLAAVGNRVEALHRSAFGPITLKDGPASGAWRWLQPSELSALRGTETGEAPAPLPA
jgi:16S rRNA pseudouridine516 synthase